MKVLSIIDSLIAAGAERMAVNIANGLALKDIESHLCATHSGGPLEEFVSEKVNLIVLEKRNAFDITAFLKLVKYVKNNNISVIHAHSSSVFWAVMVKWLVGNVKVVWHDHYGFSEHLDKRPSFPLNFMARFFGHAFVVNEKLLNYSVNTIKIPSGKVSFLANFADLNFQEADNLTPDIPGLSNNPRLVCLANLRMQKDHHTLLDAFKIVKEKYAYATLYLVGGHFSDEYYHSIVNRIENDQELNSFAHVLGSRNDVSLILKSCNVGVLSSISEGLPVSLLEYGLAKLPVVCTNVGDCALVLDHGRCGKLVEPRNPELLAQSIISYLDNPSQMEADGDNLNQRVLQEFSRDSALEKIVSVYKRIV